MSTPKKTRKTYTVEEKLKIVDMIKQGRSQANVSRDFRIFFIGF